MYMYIFYDIGYHYIVKSINYYYEREEMILYCSIRVKSYPVGSDPRLGRESGSRSTTRVGSSFPYWLPLAFSAKLVLSEPAVLVRFKSFPGSCSSGWGDQRDTRHAR